ncbi:UDP-glycosyltransferase 87A2-like [Magnolia sinica]|uniref:UDP-glycosyltransferase 87A2-like n=1 Tax=Magnolia sinica TaxID=86752 RepID=UPI00265885E3|nr:UDP-glycosyltransferase 87A2-like [Magnolia sinica]
MDTIPSCHVVAMPHPGRGHINPMMNVCKLLSCYQGLVITFVVTDEWLGLIGLAPKPSNIQLRSIPNVIPSELDRGADYAGFLEAVFTKMADPFDRLLDQLNQPISCIIADTHLPWAVEIGNRRSIPVASLWTMTPAVFSIFHHYDLIMSNLHLTADDDLSGQYATVRHGVTIKFKSHAIDRDHKVMDDFRPYVTFKDGGMIEEKNCLIGIPGITSIRVRDLPSIFLQKDANGVQLLSRALQAFQSVPKSQCLMLASFYEQDTHAIDTLRAILALPIYPVGPTIPYMSLHKTSSDSKDRTPVDYFSWLDSRSKCSVLYVSLGSFLPISGPQMDEFLLGLGSSGVHFLWVARGDAGHLREAAAINGEIGLVVPWCDQLRVLSHPSIGGFLTHCGWNSTMESIFAGVPMLTFPLFWDQTTNAKSIVEDWKVGIRLKKEVGQENVVKSDEIARTVHRLMDLDGDESKELRRRARELQEYCKRAISTGGSSTASLDTFVRDFVRGRNG